MEGGEGLDFGVLGGNGRGERPDMPQELVSFVSQVGELVVEGELEGAFISFEFEILALILREVRLEGVDLDTQVFVSLKEAVL